MLKDKAEGKHKDDFATEYVDLFLVTERSLIQFGLGNARYLQCLKHS